VIQQVPGVRVEDQNLLSLLDVEEEVAAAGRAADRVDTAG
jgi:hypothetical protein